jgi:hypothetical protein
VIRVFLLLLNPAFETRSPPRLLAATLAALPSMSLIPSAPFCEQMGLIARKGLPS